MRIYEQQTIDSVWAKGEAPVRCRDLFEAHKMNPAFQLASFVRPQVPVEGLSEEFFVFGYGYVHSTVSNADYNNLRVVDVRPIPATRCPAHPDLYERVQRFGEELGLVLREPVNLSLEELFVTDEELQRVSADLRLPGPDDIAVGEDTEQPIATRERDNLLRLAGVLASMYMLRVGGLRFGTPEEPVLAPLIDEIHAHLREFNLSERGLSARVLNDKLGEAFTLRRF